MKEKMRFAPLIRVSGDEQEKTGKGLEGQKEDIINSVEMLNGVIPKNIGFKYCGQEHATVEYERKKFDELLKDCEKDLFDAVMVNDPSRWSRAVGKSEHGIEVFKKNKIRLFINTMEYNLYDPNAANYFESQVLAAKHQASLMAYKILKSKIKRAEDGICVVTWPPGREKERDQKGNVVKNGDLIIKKEYQKRLQRAVDLMRERKYAFRDICRIVNFEESWLRRILPKPDKMGDHFYQESNSKKFNIFKKIKTPCPRLLSDDDIEFAKDYFKSNKTAVFRRKKGRKYLLSGMVLCGECKRALIGGDSHRVKQRYYHIKKMLKEKKSCSKHGYSILAEQLEDIILASIYRRIGDKTGFEQAVENAFPNFRALDLA